MHRESPSPEAPSRLTDQRIVEGVARLGALKFEDDSIPMFEKIENAIQMIINLRVSTECARKSARGEFGRGGQCSGVRVGLRHLWTCAAK